jgi:hypothetical protein
LGTKKESVESEGGRSVGHKLNEEGSNAFHLGTVWGGANGKSKEKFEKVCKVGKRADLRGKMHELYAVKIAS